MIVGDNGINDYKKYREVASHFDDHGDDAVV